MQVKVIFIWKILLEALLWKRGKSRGYGFLAQDNSEMAYWSIVCLSCLQGFLVMNTDLKTTGSVLFLTEIKLSKIYGQESHN